MPIDKPDLPAIPIPNNMGMVRYLMACYIVFGHYMFLGQFNVGYANYSSLIVGLFFAFSGFLAEKSYIRHKSYREYMKARVIRLMPPYIIAVTLFFIIALILLLFTSKISKFTSSDWIDTLIYLITNLCTLNFICPNLPEVFTTHASQAVNGALWTMKVELLYCILFPLIYKLAHFRSCAKKTIIIPGLYLLFALLSYILSFYLEHNNIDLNVLHIITNQYLFYFTYYLAGVSLYYLLPLFLKYKNYITLIALAAIAGTLSFTQSNSMTERIILPASVTIIAMWLVFTGKWGIWEGKRDNLSYYMYLIHWPVIQFYIEFGLNRYIAFWTGLLLTLIVVFLISMLFNYMQKKVKGCFSCWANHIIHGIRI